MNIKRFLFLSAVFGFLLTSCGEDTAFEENPFYDEEATGDDPRIVDTSSTGGNNGGTNPLPTAPFMVAEINGTYTEFVNTRWETEVDPSQGANNESAYGYTSTAAELYFGIERPVTPGSYDIDLFTAVGSYVVDTNSTNTLDTFLVTDGRIIVDDFDTISNVYKGSFSFKAYSFIDENTTRDSVIITNGLFELNQ